MKIRDVLDKLIDKAITHRMYQWVRSDIRDINGPATWKENSKHVGELVQSLSPDERAALQGLTEADVQTHRFFGYEAHMRPKERQRQRVRGPVRRST